MGSQGVWWLPVRGRPQLTAPLLLRGYFFLTSRFESSEAITVLRILSPKNKRCLKWLTFERKNSNQQGNKRPIRKFWSSVGQKADQGSKDVRTFSGYMIVGHRWARSKTPMNKNKYPSRRNLGNPHETPNEPHDLVTIALSLISQFGYVLINFFRPPSMKHQWSTKGWESPTTSWEKVSTRQGA